MSRTLDGREVLVKAVGNRYETHTGDPVEKLVNAIAARITSEGEVTPALSLEELKEKQRRSGLYAF